jgi:hypothetical protein
MFNINQPKRTGGAAQQAPVDGLIALDTPVEYDPGLVDRLVAEHRALEGRLGRLADEWETDPLIERSVHACSAKLHDLRRTEALWLYPLIARRLARDPVTRRQFLQLRLVMLGLARRTLRACDELLHAVGEGIDTKHAVAEARRALAEYRQRNEGEIYPLYQLMGTTRRADGMRVA